MKHRWHCQLQPQLWRWVTHASSVRATPTAFNCHNSMWHVTGTSPALKGPLISWSCHVMPLTVQLLDVFGHFGEVTDILYRTLPVSHVSANRQKTPCICSVLVGQLEIIQEHEHKVNKIKHEKKSGKIIPDCTQSLKVPQNSLQHLLFQSVPRIRLIKSLHVLCPAVTTEVTTQVRYSECRGCFNLRLQALRTWPSSVPQPAKCTMTKRTWSFWWCSTLEMFRKRGKNQRPVSPVQSVYFDKVICIFSCGDLGE